MSNEVATLQFKANVSDLKTSNAELDKLAQSAGKAEKAVDGLNDGLEGVGKAGAAAGAGLGKFNDENGHTSDSARQGNEALRKQREEMAKLMDKIDPTRAALRNLGDAQKQLREGWSSGVIDTKQFMEFNRIITAQEAIVKKNASSIREMSEQFKKGAISAGQMSAGWSNASNQLIDIGVSLQGGMSPLTVMTQQLPQLAMSFGSFGNTMAVFAGLINPVTIGVTALVAGVGYLGYQSYQAAKQTEQLNNALASSGYMAAQSAGSLKTIAASVKDVGDMSKGQAIDLVAQVTALGFAGDAIGRVSLTVASLSKQTGQSTDDLVKQLSGLNGDPVAAMYKLNEQYHFLNESTRTAVESLVEQGKEMDAQTLIIDALNDKMGLYSKVTVEVLQGNMSWWQKLTGTIAEAYHMTSQAQAAAAGIELPGIDNVKAAAVAMEATQAFMQETNAESQKYNDKQIAFRRQMDASDKSMMSNAERRTAEAKKYADAVAKGYITQKEADKHLSDFNSKYKDPKNTTKKAAAVQVDAGDRLTDQYRAQNLALDAQIQLLKSRSTGEANASKERKDYLLLQARYQVLEDKARTEALSKAEKQELAAKDTALAQAKITAEKGDELAHLQRQAQLNDEIAKKTETAKAAQQEQLNVAGQSTRIMQRKIRDAETLAKLTAQQATEDQKKAALDADAIKDRTEDLGRSDWVSASKTAMADWADSATNYAKIAADAITQGMDLAASAVSNFVLTGKMDFAGFARDVLKMITDIITRMLVMKALTAAGSAMGFDMSFMSPNAKGGVYQEPSLHAYANQVYSSPQTFQFNGRSKFAKGGVFAEAGPEAIMPLTRDANGKLGVKAEGTGGSTGDVNVVTNVNIDSNGNATATTQGAGAQVGQQISAAVQDEVRRMMKPGGLLFKRS